MLEKLWGKLLERKYDERLIGWWEVIFYIIFISILWSMI
jgi:hypothetical protein